MLRRRAAAGGAPNPYFAALSPARMTAMLLSMNMNSLEAAREARQQAERDARLLAERLHLEAVSARRRAERRTAKRTRRLPTGPRRPTARHR